jgi:hypothetical protein
MSAATDRIVRVPPALPTIGARNTVFLDTTYGSRNARVTDGGFTTDLGITNRSFRTPAAAYQLGWNADGTRLFVCGGGGEMYVVNFDRTTMANSRYGNALPFGSAGGSWDRTDPNKIYGVGLQVNHHTIISVNTSTTGFATTVVIDLDTVMAGLNSPDETYVGAIQVFNGILMCTFGGKSQEYHRYVLYYPLANPAGKKVLDTLSRNGMDGANTHFTMHSAQMDKSGQFANLVPTGSSLPTGSVAPYRNYIWDMVNDTVQPVLQYSGGHEVMGDNGARINMDCITSWDAIQYILTPTVATPNSGRIELITPLFTPGEIYAADHSSWHNSKATSLEPFFVSIYRYYDGPLNIDPKNNSAIRALDGEIAAVETVRAGGTIWRFGHHHSLVAPDTGTGAFEFWYTPRGNVDFEGKFVAYTSNKNKSLGTDSAEGIARQDVFVMECLRDTTPTRDDRIGYRGISGRVFTR